MRAVSTFATFVFCMLFAACGGGGGDSGSTPFGTGSGSTSSGTGGTSSSDGGSTSTSSPSLSLSISSLSTSSAAPATVTATVLDAQQQAVVSTVVSFTSRLGLGDFSVGAALTDASGQATVLLLPANSTAVGADEVIASATVSGESVQATQGFQVQASTVPVSITSLTSSVDSGTLSAYGQTALTLVLNGASISSPVQVLLTSSCLTQDKAAISPVSFTATTAVTSIQYKDSGCGALQEGDTLQASIVGAAAATPTALDIKIASPAISSIAFVSATPEVIYLQGSGLGEVSQVVFELRDVAGNPLPNQDISLALSTFTGGITLEGGILPVTQSTDNQGRVSARINSGTVPTPVRIIATVGATGIQTVSSGLSVAVGLPSQLSFSLSQGMHNIEGWNFDGTPNTYTIIPSDRSGNPVPALTSVNFVTKEGGQIVAIEQTSADNGLTSVSAQFQSSAPRPDDGRITVLTYALGEESFLDMNGNNVYDAGEPFQDLGDVYVDRNFDGLQDPAIDEFISLGISASGSCTAPGSVLLSLDASMPSIPGTCDGQWGPAYVRRSIETVLSTSESDPVWRLGFEPGGGLSFPGAPGSPVTLRTGPTSATTTFFRVDRSSINGAGTEGTISFIVRDKNTIRLNPIAADSTITVEASSGLTVKVLGGTPVTSTTEVTSAAVSYKFADDTNSGTITVHTVSPKGVDTATSFSIDKFPAAAPSSSASITSFDSTVGGGTLGAYGQTELTVTLAGASITSPASVEVTSTCLTQGKAELSPVSFLATSAVTTVLYKDKGCGALQAGDTLNAAVVGSTAPPTSLDINIGTPAVSSIAFVSATPSIIFLKGSGSGPETSQVVFEVRDTAGVALPNQDVNLALSTFTGGITMEGGTVPVTIVTDEDGQVLVRVNSGSVPTPLRVTATLGGIQTVSSGLSIAVGLPSQLNFSLSQNTPNIEAFNLDGISNSYTIIPSDRSGNPVPALTSFNFVTKEGGQIVAIEQTSSENALTSVTARFQSSSPRPADGRITVLAYALGEESFLDLNGNNVHDAGEPFQDLGNIYTDRNFDGAWDSSVDEFISLDIAATGSCVVPASTLLSLNVSMPSVPGTCDGVWGAAYVRRAAETVLSTSGSDPVWFLGREPAVSGTSVELRTSSALTTTTFRRVSGSVITGAGVNGVLPPFLVRDTNSVRLNPVAARSIITVVATTGITAEVLSGSPVPGTLSASGASVSYDFTDILVTSGVITIKVTSPSGVTSSASVSIFK